MLMYIVIDLNSWGEPLATWLVVWTFSHVVSMSAPWSEGWVIVSRLYPKGYYNI